MYKVTHNLIAIPISDFLIPLVRPSRHYHPLSYRLITAKTDYYNFSFFPRAVFHWNNLHLPLETVACGRCILVTKHTFWELREKYRCQRLYMCRHYLFGQTPVSTPFICCWRKLFFSLIQCSQGVLCIVQGRSNIISSS